MLYGNIKPIVIKVINQDRKYKKRGFFLKHLRVIAFDMKNVLVADDKAYVHCFPWKHIELVASEQIMQMPIAQTIDNTKVVNRIKEKKPFFKAGQQKKQENTK